MKKIIFMLVCFLCLSVSASEFKTLPFKNIEEGDKVTVSNSNQWISKVKRNDQAYTRNGSLLYSDEQSKTFDTDCDNLFIKEGKLLGYSASYLKFYEFTYTDENVTKQELDPDEVSILFKDFHIILISEFSDTTNVYRFKKKRGTEKVIVLNDTDNIFENYEFTSNNARFEKYEINNAIDITKKGLIQFSTSDESAKLSPWFIILVR